MATVSPSTPRPVEQLGNHGDVLPARRVPSRRVAFDQLGLNSQVSACSARSGHVDAECGRAGRGRRPSTSAGAPHSATWPHGVPRDCAKRPFDLRRSTRLRKPTIRPEAKHETAQTDRLPSRVPARLREPTVFRHNRLQNGRFAQSRRAAHHQRSVRADSAKEYPGVGQLPPAICDQLVTSTYARSTPGPTLDLVRMFPMPGTARCPGPTRADAHSPTLELRGGSGSPNGEKSVDPCGVATYR